MAAEVADGHPSVANIASRGATMAVDWEQRIDFARLRSDRLEKARASLRDSELGAVLLFDQNNIRYVSSTHIGEWARDKSARCVLLPREGDPVLWDFGSAAKHHRLYAPWLPESSWQAGVTSMRGAMPEETGVPDCARGPHPPGARRARSCRRAAGDRPDRHGDPVFAAASGDRDGRRPAGDDARPRDQDGGGDRAARARRRDRRCRLRGDLPDASPGRPRARDRGTRRCRCCSSSAPSRSRRSTPSPATAATPTRTCSPTGCCDPATRRSSTSSTRSWATGRATTARSTSAASPSPRSTRTSSAASGSTGDRARPPRRHDRPDRERLADRARARLPRRAVVLRPAVRARPRRRPLRGADDLTRPLTRPPDRDRRRHGVRARDLLRRNRRRVGSPHRGRGRRHRHRQPDHHQIPRRGAARLRHELRARRRPRHRPDAEPARV